MPPTSPLTAFLMQLLLQPAATSGPGGAAGGGSGGGTMGCGLQMAMMVGIFALTYFLLLRPERQRQLDAEKLQSSLRAGMKVRTTSGILGEILRLNEDGRSVTLGIADKVRINILRANIAGPEVEVAEKAADKDKDKAEAKPAEEKKA
jgi:preprotein translocase subunit YajC